MEEAASVASAGEGVEPSAAESDDSPLRRDKPRTPLRRGSRRSRSSRSSSSSSSSSSSNSSSSNSNSSSSSSTSSSSSSSSSGSASDSSSSSSSSSQSSSSRGWSPNRGSSRGRARLQSPRKSLSPQGACSGSPSPEGSAIRRRLSDSPSCRSHKWWSSSERSASRSLSPQGACSGGESSPRASSRSRSPTDISSRCHSVVQVFSSSSPRAASTGSRPPQRTSTVSRFHSSTSRTRPTSPDRVKPSTSPSSTIQRNGNDEGGSISFRAQEQPTSPLSQLPHSTYGLKVSNIGSSKKSRRIKNFLKQRFKSFGNLVTATIQGTGKDRYGLLFYKYGLDREKALKAKVRNPFGKVLQIECWDGPPPVNQAEGSTSQISSATYGLRITNMDIGIERQGLLTRLKWEFLRFGNIVSASIHGEGKDRYGLVFYKHQKDQKKALASRSKFKTAIGDLKMSPWNGPPVNSEGQLSHLIKQEKIEAPNERHHKDQNLLSSMSVDRPSASESAKPTDVSLPQSPSRRFALKITNIGFHFKNTVLKKNLSHPMIKRFLKKEFMRFGNVTSLETYGSAKNCYALVFFNHRREQKKAIANKKRFCFLTKKSKVTEWNGLPPVKENRHNLSKSQFSCNNAKSSKSHSSRYSRSQTPLSQIASRRSRYNRSRSPLLPQSGFRRSIHSRSSSPSSHKSKNRSSRSRARHSRSQSPDPRSRPNKSRSPDSYRSALVSESKHEQKAVTSDTPRHVVNENEMSQSQLAMSRTRLGLTELSSSLHKASLTLWINNLAETITSADLCTGFQPFGEVQHIEIREGFRNRGKQAFLQYSAVRSVYKAIEQMNGRFFGDQKLQLDFAYPRHATNCVWVYGLLLAKTTQLHLTVIFEEFGPVLKLLHDPIQGTALVLYKDTASAKKAVEQKDMNRIAGHRVRVGYANLRCQLGFCHSMESSGQPVGDFYQLVGASEN